MWEQTRGWNSNKGGKQAGMCLRNVRMGYDIPPKYDDAWTAWLNTEQHRDRNFPNLYTPIYFSYTATIDGIKKNYGHIGVRYPDGRFWSDGKVFASVEAYENAHAPVFVGWGESVNGVKVIKVQGDDMITKDNTAEVRIIMSEVEGWPGHEVHAGKHDKQIMGTWTGKSWSEFIWHTWNVQKVKRHDLTALVGQLQKQLADTKQALANEQQKLPKEVVKEIEKIIEKPVEVIKEVEVAVDKPLTWERVLKFVTDKLSALWQRIRS